MQFDIARIQVTFYEAGAFIHGGALIKFMSEPGTFEVRKRMWWPDWAPFWKYDFEHDDRREITKDCAFINLTPIGVSDIGIYTGAMDFAITASNLSLVILEDVGKILDYAEKMAPPFKKHVTNHSFLAAFEHTGGGFRLRGVVDTGEGLQAVIKPM